MGKVFYILIKVILGEQTHSDHTHKHVHYLKICWVSGLYVNLSPSVNFQVNSELECCFFLNRLRILFVML